MRNFAPFYMTFDFIIDIFHKEVFIQSFPFGEEFVCLGLLTGHLQGFVIVYGKLE